MRKFLFWSFFFVSSTCFCQILQETTKDSILPKKTKSVNDTISIKSDTTALEKKASLIKSDSLIIKKDSPLPDSLVINKNNEIPLKNLDAENIHKTPKKITYRDYLIISHQNDTTFIDTTLTIKKYYRNNFLRRDDFELIAFPNIGAPYNRLGHNYKIPILYPDIGATGKHYDYTSIEDVKYYHVPTPSSEIFYRTGLEQGQTVESFITVNPSEQINIALTYKGLRSQGKYRHSIASIKKFGLTLNYHSKDKRFNHRSHVYTHNYFNEENGGIYKPLSQFENGDEEFLSRIRVDVNFEDASNELVEKRYFIENQYSLFQKPKTELIFGHRGSFLLKYFQFSKSKITPDLVNDDSTILGPLIYGEEIHDNVDLQIMKNQLYFSLKNNLLGALLIEGYNIDNTYYFPSLYLRDINPIANKFYFNENGIELEWKKSFNKTVLLTANFGSNLSGTFGGNYYSIYITYNHTDNLNLKIGGLINEHNPNYNTLLYQSDYESYNWSFLNTFKKQKKQTISTVLNFKKWINLDISYTFLDNYTYFINQNQLSLTSGEFQTLPKQYDKTIDYLKIKLYNELTFWRIGIANTFLYQQIDQSEEILNLPEIVFRNSIYYQNDVFKKAGFLQIGFTTKIFKNYFMNSYNSLLSEFYVQQENVIGEFPLINIFANLRVKRARIYFMYEHINSEYTGYSYYSAPYVPYRDGIFRLGMVWNFFL